MLYLGFKEAGLPLLGLGQDTSTLTNQEVIDESKCKLDPMDPVCQIFYSPSTPIVDSSTTPTSAPSAPLPTSEKPKESHTLLITLLVLSFISGGTYYLYKRAK
jgi:hypothetical protein